MQPLPLRGVLDFFAQNRQPLNTSKSRNYLVRSMALHEFDAEQIQRACAVLSAYGIEPTDQVMQALVETADVHYPNDPARFEKAAQALVAFFGASAIAPTKQERSWQRLRYWALSVLRLGS